MQTKAVQTWDEYRTKDRARRLTPVNQAKTRARMQAYNAQHPERRAATDAIAKAIAKGRLVRPERCTRCNRKTRIEAHHHKGYAQEYRLDVLWVCKSCHGVLER